MVRELVGHGLGKSMHEDPQVPNYGKRGHGPKLKEGMVLAIEPMINMGKKKFIPKKTAGRYGQWIINHQFILNIMFV